MKRFKELLFTFCFFTTCIYAIAQNRELSGKVIASKDNSPVAGATVTVKGTTRSVAAGDDGSFRISVPSGGVTLTVSSINYSAQDVRVDPSQKNVVVSLGENNGQLGEVVVTALGIQRQAKTLVYATQT